MNRRPFHEEDPPRTSGCSARTGESSRPPQWGPWEGPFQRLTPVRSVCRYHRASAWFAGSLITTSSNGGTFSTSPQHSSLLCKWALRTLVCFSYIREYLGRSRLLPAVFPCCHQRRGRGWAKAIQSHRDALSKILGTHRLVSSLSLKDGKGR